MPNIVDPGETRCLGADLRPDHHVRRSDPLRLAHRLLAIRGMGAFSEHLHQLADALLVLVLAGLIGFEREAHHRPAGLRTHIVVGLSAWLLVTVGVTATEAFAGEGGVRPDPIRIVQAVIYGISFIGAGTIINSRRENRPVLGLTTASSLLATAAIAISIGFGERFLACAITVIILLVLLVLGALERRICAAKSER